MHDGAQAYKNLAYFYSIHIYEYAVLILQSFLLTNELILNVRYC